MIGINKEIINFLEFSDFCKTYISFLMFITSTSYILNVRRDISHINVIIDSISYISC